MPRMLLTLALGICVAACSYPSRASGAPEQDSAGYYAGLTKSEASSSPRAIAAERASTDKRSNPAPLAETPDRQVIHSAELAIEVSQVERAIEETVALVTAGGGYLSQRHDQRLTLRVPAAEFEATLAAVKEMGRVIRQARQAQDVTEQWLDLRVRIDNARRARQRLLALLERAEAVEDILKIEKELTRLTTEIERMEAQLANLDNRVALSTLTVTFVTPEARPDRPQRQRSRFDWINDVGADRAMRSF